MKRIYKLIGHILFSIITIVLGIWYATSKSDTSLQDILVIKNFPLTFVAILILISILIYVADALRYLVISRSLKVNHITFFECIEMSVANFFFTWISPFGVLGAPVIIYMLHKKNVRIGTAAILSLGKSIIGTFLLVCMSFVLILNFKSSMGAATLAINSITIALWVFVSLFLTLLIIALLHKRIPIHCENKFIHKLLVSLIKTSSTLMEFFNIGLKNMLKLLLVNILYVSLFVLPLVLLLLKLGSVELFDTITSSVIHITLAYIAPTPHGSGITDLLIKDLFSPLLSFKKAVVAIIIFRSMTFYLQIFIGSSYMIVKTIRKKIH